MANGNGPTNPFLPKTTGGSGTVAEAFANYLKQKYPTQDLYQRESGYFAHQPFGVGGQALFDLVTESIFGSSVPTGGEVLQAESGQTVAPGQPVPPTLLKSGAQPIDVTDPTVDVGDLKLNRTEQIIRRFRYLGRAVHGALTGAGTSAGIQRLQQEGQLAPPKDNVDRVLLGLAPMVAAAGIFGVGGGLAGLTGAGEAAAGEAAATGIRGLAGTDVNAVLGRALLRGNSAGRLAELTGGALTPEAIKAGTGGVLIDALIGSAYGAGEVKMAEQLGELTPEEAAQSYGKAALWGGAFGLGLGAATRAILHPITSIDVARNVLRKSQGIEVGVDTPVGVDIGDIVAGKKAVGRTPRGSYMWHDENGKLTKAPSDEDLRAFYLDKAHRLSSGEGISQVSPEAAQAEVQKVDPENPDFLTSDLKDRVPDMGIIGAEYYVQQVPSLMKNYRPEQLQAMLLALKEQFIDTSVPLLERVTAGGRILALEHALGEGGGTIPGLMPFDAEVAAVQMVKQMSRAATTDQIVAQAAEIRTTQPELANRIEQLATREDWPTRYHNEVTKRLKNYSALQSRGFAEGDVAVTKDGQMVRLLDNPDYGFANVLPLGRGEGVTPPKFVDVNDLVPIPKAGQYVRLRNGRTIKVRAVRPETFQFQSERWYSIGDIDAVAGTKEDLIPALKAEKAAATKDQPGTAQPIPPVKAATSAGEPVTVTAIGEKEVTVRTKSGQTKTMPKSEIQQSEPAEVTPGVPPERQVVAFTPGRLPQPGNRILFFSVKRPSVAAFEQGVKAGQIPRDAIASGGPASVVYAHVLPPHTVNADAALYAAEMPASLLPKKLYSAAANSAVDALGGKEVIGTYASPVDVPIELLNQAQIYQVPNALHAAAQRPVEALAAMTQAEQTAYLRHLIAFNENITTEVMKPIRAASETRVNLEEAANAGDAQTALSAKSTLADQNAESMSAAADSDIKAQGPDVTQEIISSPTPEAQAMRALEKSGITDETRATWNQMLNDMDISTNKVDRELLVLYHTKNPRLRLFIRRIMEPGAERTETGALKPSAVVRWESVPVSDRGVVFKQARQRFNTPEELTAYMEQNGFGPSVTKLTTAEYGHPRKPSITGTIRPTAKARVQALVEERNLEGLVPPKDATYSSPKLTTEQGKVIAQVGEQYIHDETSHVGIRELESKEFDTVAEAEKWLASKGIKKRQTPVDYIFAKDFEKLPPVDQLPNLSDDQLSQLHDELFVAMRNLQRIQRRELPDAVIEYGAELGKLYYDKFGDLPFNREYRLKLAIPSPRDIGPRAKGFSDVVAGGQVANPVESIYADVPFGGVLEEAGPTMHLGQASSRSAPPDYYELFTTLLGHDEAPKNPVIEQAKFVEKSLTDQTKWTDAFDAARKSPVGERVQFSPDKIPVAKYKPTGQVVEIVHVPEAGNEVVVKFPGESELSVVKDDLQLPGELAVRKAAANVIPYLEARNIRFNETQSWRKQYGLAELVHSGKYVDVFKREPPLGFGKIERDMGLLGADRSTIQSAFYNRAQELAQTLSVTKGGVLSGPPRNVSEMLDLYARSLWLDQITPATKATFGIKGEGITPATVPTLEVSANKTSDLVLKAMTDVDKKLEKPFRLSVYHTIKSQLGSTDLADLQARATSGLGLSEETEKILRGWGSEIGLPANTPLGRVVSELTTRKLLNPQAANLAAYLRKNAGFVKWSKDIGDPPAGTFVLKVPEVRDVTVLGEQGVPWKIMRRHPVTRLVMDLVYRAQEREIVMNHDYHTLDFMLRKEYKTDTALKTIKDLRLKYNTWGEAEAAGVNPKWRFGFERTAEFFDNRLEDLKRQLLRQNVQLVKYDPNNPAMVAMAEEHGLPSHQIAEGMVMYPKFPATFESLEKAGVKGITQSGFWDANNIEAFLRLQRQYATAAELPATTPEPMKEVFDFWKGWGRKNYWPLIHEGNLAITVRRGSEDQIVGFVQQFPDIPKAIRQLQADGRLSAGDMETIQVKNLKPRIYDDVIVRSVPNKEFENIIKASIDQTDLGPEDVAALLYRTDKAQEFIPVPEQVHAKARIRNLEPIFDDPSRELAVYNARIARIEYYWNVMEAYKILQDRPLDRSMSSAYGIDTVGEGGMPNLMSYTKNWVRRALGEQGWIEKKTDQVLGYMTWLTKGTVLRAKKALGGDVPIPWKELRNPNTFYKRYAARAKSSDILGFQTMWRLGGSVGSAFANATQFWVTTLPKLMREGDNPARVMQEAFQAWRDGANLWYTRQFRPGSLGGLSPELQQLDRLMQQSGIAMAPSKTMAGTRSFTELEATRPYRQKSGVAGTGQLALDWGKYVSMLGFNGAERTNRYGTAIVAMRRALADGGSEADAIAAARNLVRETQFQYDDLSIPQLMAQAGPLGRIFFQFKPFLVNMLSYEKDLLTGMFGMNPEISSSLATKQLATHIGSLAAFGGLVGAVYNPVVSMFTGLAKLVSGKDMIQIAGHQIPLTGEGASIMARENRMANQTLEENFSHSVHAQAEDLLYYGLPGLLGLSLGQRVGVSGQDVLYSLEANNLLGPTFSVYGDMWTAWKNYLQATPDARTRAVAGGALGTALGATAANVLRENFGVPYFAAATGLLGGSLATLGTTNPFHDFLKSDEGKTLAMKDTPTVIRNFIRTMQLFKDGAFVDINGKPQHVPVDDRTQEMGYMIAGLPSVAREEYSAVTSMLLSNANEEQMARTNLIDQIARAWVKRDYKTAYDAIFRARTAGLNISESAIQRRIDALTNERLDTIRQRIPKDQRIAQGGGEE